jgi:hypothetical protein
MAIPDHIEAALERVALEDVITTRADADLLREYIRGLQSDSAARVAASRWSAMTAVVSAVMAESKWVMLLVGGGGLISGSILGASGMTLAVQHADEEDVPAALDDAGGVGVGDPEE